MKRSDQGTTEKVNEPQPVFHTAEGDTDTGVTAIYQSEFKEIAACFGILRLLLPNQGNLKQRKRTSVFGQK